MPPRLFTMDDGSLRFGLAAFQASLDDKGPLLKVAGELMRASIARTFRDEGSPAGSWAKLALSTLKKKSYTSGHKLLILSGRLFGSIDYQVDGDTLTIGTNLAYAAVQNFGSADRTGGSSSPQARIPGRTVQVGAHHSGRIVPFKKYGMAEKTDSKGRVSSRRTRLEGPANRASFSVAAHGRFQNIPARPFMVFRPEDPQRIMSGFEAYLRGKLVKVGTVTV